MAATGTGPASSVNGTPSTKVPSSTQPTSPTPQAPSGRNSTLPLINNRSVEGDRKSSISSVEAMSQNKRNSTQKAWTSGVNPLTKSSQIARPVQPNGAAPVNKPAAGSKGPISTAKESNTPEYHASDRLFYLYAHLVGLRVTIALHEGDQFEGIFVGITSEIANPFYRVNMVRKLKSSNASANGSVGPNSDYVGKAPDYQMRFELKDVVDLTAMEVSLAADTLTKSQGVNSFLTDTDISGNRTLRERTLQRWEPSADADADMSLEGGSTNATGAWDQFETNKRLYGVQSDYNPDFYTTAINSNKPNFARAAAEAERLAREIERGSSSNPHVREERGLAGENDANGVDEEAKYSGVRRGPQDFPALSSGPNRYTPPARRAPTGQPTVPGAPVDPAIISSQIARPGAAAQAMEKSSSNTSATKATVNGGDSATAITSKPVKTPIVPSNGSNKPSGLSVEPGKKPALPSGDARSQRAEGHTATVEVDVRDAFKQFANEEKLRVQQRKQDQKDADKKVRLNDLMKFSQNFKLNTPVPKDLVSILAKDPSKQEAIVEKAARIAAEAPAPGTSSKKPLATIVDPKTQRTQPQGRMESSRSGHTLSERQSNDRRGGNVPMVPYGTPSGHGDRTTQIQPLQSIPPRVGPGLSQRLANIHVQNRVNAGLSGYQSQQDSRPPPVGPAAGEGSGSQRSSGAPTPLSSSSSKFNVKAMEFKPNPAARSFSPNDASSARSSPRSTTNVKPTSRRASPSAFLGNKKPLPASERPSISDYFNPIKRLKTEAKLAKEDWPENGGIPWAHKTLPRWDITGENSEKTYVEVFEEMSLIAQSVSPRAVHGNSHSAHQHQLPFHLQQAGPGMPHLQAPHHMQPHMLHQHSHHPGVPHQYDDHRMQYSSSASSVYPSPRLPHANLPYQSPMMQNAQLVYNQPVQYQMGPGAPQMAQYRSFSGGPQLVPHPGQGGAPMMAHNPSNGPYMGVPQGMAMFSGQQVPMYAPGGQAPGYHPAGPQAGPPGSHGYPSPGRGAPMMMHQGSQQGHQPPQMVMYNVGPNQHPQQQQQMYASHQPGHMSNMRGGYPPQQSQYMQGPPQSHQYGHQHRGHHGGNYGHQQQQQQHLPPQPAHQNGPPGPSPNMQQSQPVEADADGK